MFKRSHYIVFGFVLLFVLVLLNLPSQTTAQFKLAIGSLFLPLFGLASSGQHLVEKAADATVPRSVLLAETKRLEKENQEFRLQAMQHSQVLEENNQLRQALGWQRQVLWKLKLARVTARDPANWWRSLQIDLGSRDSISTNYPVLTIDGLVGRIDQVGPRSSRVLLLGDPNCRVSAMIEKNRESGILGVSSGSLIEQNMLDLTYLSRRAVVEPGLRVVTSGNGGIFPPGIPIGEIADSRSIGYELYREARVKLFANLKQLEMVWVKLP
jgi:rod shape-determining protein MreC